MDRHNWATVKEERLNPLMSRWVVHTPGMTIARLRLLKGAVVPLHQHHNEQVTMLKSGALRFDFPDFPDSPVTLAPGDVLVIPPNRPHSVETLEESLAEDLFTPARQDWIRGDGAYLRG
jgi:quercetin dioxygenase-like cupin family protein